MKKLLIAAFCMSLTLALGAQNAYQTEVLSEIEKQKAEVQEALTKKNEVERNSRVAISESKKAIADFDRQLNAAKSDKKALATYIEKDKKALNDCRNELKKLNYAMSNSTSVSAADQDKVEELENEISRLEVEIADKTAELKALNREISNVRKDISDARKSITDRKKDNRDAAKNLSDAKKSLKEAQKVARTINK